jgi:hypothetical protein
MSQFERIGIPAMRDFKRYAMPFSAFSAPLTTLSNVEGEWVVRNLQVNGCGITCYQENGNNIMLPVVIQTGDFSSLVCQSSTIGDFLFALFDGIDN